MNRCVGKSIALLPLTSRGTSLLLFSIGLVALNALDVIFTLKILGFGGIELNPLARGLIDLGVGYFITVKLTTVLLGVICLCLCDKFIRTRRFLFILFNIYCVLILYEIFCYGVMI